jgi:hypothetical protein
LADVLRSAFAIFSLKSPSLLTFKELTWLPETAIEPNRYGDYFEMEACPCLTSIQNEEDCLAANF